jgi:hypothetical protein
VKPRMLEAGLITEDGGLADDWIARVDELREVGGEITQRELVRKRHARERERFRRRRTGDPHGGRGVTQAGIDNIMRSRKRRWEHLKNPPPTPAKLPAQEARVRYLVKQGMAEKYAREQVYGGEAETG